jgi:hypothetical protein
MRQFLEQLELHLVMVAASAEAQQAEHSERQGQRQRVARILGGVGADHRQRLRRRAIDGERDRLDVAPLPRGGALAKRQRPRRLRPCLGNERAKLQQSGAGDMREGEIGVGPDRAIEQLFRTVIGGEQQVDRGDVILDRSGSGAGERQIEAVLQRHGLPQNLAVNILHLLRVFRSNEQL